MSAEKLSALRELLSRRFPQAAVGGARRGLPTGIAAIDEATGGLPTGAITEIVCAEPSCGGALLLAQVLATCRENRVRVALVDGANSFDPGSFSSDLLAHLVWVRPPHLKALLQAADLVARDANFGLLAIDLRAPHLAPEIRKEPSTSWYRLQRAAEQTDLPLLVQTPRPLVPSAQLRFVLEKSFSLADQARERPTLTAQLAPVMQRQRMKEMASSG